MKTLALFTIILIGFFGIIIGLARPDIIQKQYTELTAPLDQYLNEKKNKEWREAKENDYASWMLKLHLPADCGMPKTAIREMECANARKQHALTFEQNWVNKVNNGWKPE